MYKEWGWVQGAIKRIQNRNFVYREFMVLAKQADSTYIFFTFKIKTKIK